MKPSGTWSGGKWSSLILICAAFACFTLRRASAAKRHAVWTLAVLGALLLPLAAAILPLLPAAEKSVQLVGADLHGRRNDFVEACIDQASVLGI